MYIEGELHLFLIFHHFIHLHTDILSYHQEKLFFYNVLLKGNQVWTVAYQLPTVILTAPLSWPIALVYSVDTAFPGLSNYFVRNFIITDRN